MKVIVVIPAYNAESTIGDIVRRSYKYADVVVVVDNNSTDLTRFEAKDAGAYIVMEHKQGAGAATRAGIDFAKKVSGDWILVTLDGDGQHAPEDIPKLLSPIQFLKHTDIVIGSRLRDVNSNMPRYRRFGISVITWLYNIGSKDKIIDSQCCFRAFSKKALDMIKIEDNGFGFSTEMLIKARKLGFKIIEVPMPCAYYKSYRQNSTLNPIRHGLEVALKTAYWRVKCMS